jgi:hypothetical protein
MEATEAAAAADGWARARGVIALMTGSVAAAQHSTLGQRVLTSGNDMLVDTTIVRDIRRHDRAALQKRGG